MLKFSLSFFKRWYVASLLTFNFAFSEMMLDNAESIILWCTQNLSTYYRCSESSDPWVSGSECAAYCERHLALNLTEGAHWVSLTLAHVIFWVFRNTQFLTALNCIKHKINLNRLHVLFGCHIVLQHIRTYHTDSPWADTFVLKYFINNNFKLKYKKSFSSDFSPCQYYQRMWW